MSATVETTIARLYRSGFAPARIAELVRRSPTVVRKHIPADAVPPVDLSWLPTAAMRSAARQILMQRMRMQAAPHPRGNGLPDSEVKLIRLLAAKGSRIDDIAKTLTRLGDERTRHQVYGAIERNGITIQRRRRRVEK